MSILGLAMLTAVTVFARSPPAQAEGGQPETVLTNISLPTITGSAIEGETLQEQHARWTIPPAGYAYQWQRCDSAGEHCEGIEKATAQSYRLIAADVGHTIRVSESAKNSAGAVTSAASEPTAVVQSHGGGQGSGGGNGQGGSGGQSGGNQGGNKNSRTPEAHSHTKPATLTQLLARQLAPRGAADSRAALLRNDGASLRIDLPRSGTLTVRWYLPLAVAMAGGKAGRRMTLLASSGRAMVRAAKPGMLEIKLTARGRELLAHARDARLKAQGSFTVKGGKVVSASSSFSLRG